MEDADLTTSDALQCPRDGCDDMLKNVEALKMHLAIHEIAEEVDDLYADSFSISCRPFTEISPLVLTNATVAM